MGRLLSILGLSILVLVAAPGAEDQEQLRADYQKIAGKEALAAVPEGHVIVVTELYDGAFSRGRVKTMAVQTADGIKDGLEVEKVAFGWRQIRATPYVAGERHGTERFFAQGQGPDGKRRQVVTEEVPWRRGVIHGEKISYHPNGQIQTQVEYVDGRPHGAGITYDEEGRTLRETVYVDGERHGETVEYHAETGEVKRRLPYREGEIHGLVEEFYSNGELKRKVPCREGVFHGVEEEYASDGTLRARRYWLDDERVDKAAYQAAEGG